MADPFDDAFAQIGADFESLMPSLELVTVASVDPDSGTATTTTANVPALKRSRRRFPFRVGQGEIGGDQCRFVFKAARVSFIVKGRDKITDASGTVWEVDDRGAELIAKGQLWAVNVTRARS